MSELKPCPFCGSPAIAVDDDGLTFVRCQPGSGCKGTGLISFWQTENSDTAIAAWNTRALPADQVGVWGAMEPKTNVSSESHRKGAFRSPAHPPGITL
ncbi:Lar family restriction alleviation protein [Pseudomonas aeruginosa]|nr:Lar family restriction alleviation protein [Pseudomonas aeruginosa]